MYPSQEVAEDALIESWTHFEFNPGNGPIAVYRCDDCGQYHLTSKGPMNERLSKALSSGSIQLRKEAQRWLNKFRRK